jgi:predicted nuclease of predicted toxin-antitoxin system
MKIFVDENIPLMTVRVLREMGHDVRDIRGTADEGMTDDALWETVQREGRLLITTDKGFTQHRYELHHGILIVRLKQPNRHKIHQRVMQAMAHFAAEEWVGLLVVMRDVVQSVWRTDARSRS